MKITLNTFKNSTLNIHVVGATAVEGSVIARFLNALGAKHVTLHDFCEKKEYAKRFLAFHNGVADRASLWQMMRKLPYPIHFADTYLQGIEDADVLFLPQAWYKYDFNLPTLANIVQAGKVATSSMTDLCLQLFPGVTVGVTGTHGKTTVTRLISHVLKDTNKKVFTSGNERHSEQILDHIVHSEIRAQDILVLEISNRQLKQKFEKGPQIAVITNVYPNHLDEHKDFAEYRETKMRIADGDTQGRVIVGGGDAILLAWARDHHYRIVDQEKLRFIREKFTLPITLRGEHNQSNVAIVYELSQLFSVSDSQFQKAIESFPGVEKRQECVFENEKMQLINDSSATTPTATLMAVKTFAQQPLFLIMGGDDKNIPQSSWDTLITFLRDSENVTVVVLPGTIRDKFSYENTLHLESLDQALAAAGDFVLQQKSPSIVLVSPAGEAFYTKFLIGKSLEKVAQNYFSSSTTLRRG